MNKTIHWYHRPTLSYSIAVASVEGVTSVPASQLLYNHTGFFSIFRPRDALCSRPLELIAPNSISSKSPSPPVMVNFAVDPAPFLPSGVQVKDGGNQRIPRAVVNLAGNILHVHEEYI
jgi:hypothetical protein